jgi:lipid-binding SYLF domain-containing protein
LNIDKQRDAKLMTLQSKEIEMKTMKTRVLLTHLAVVAILLCTTIVRAQKAAELDRKVDEAQAKLFATSPAAKNLSKSAKGILIFPTVKKAGFVVGGQYGEGALREGGKTVGYYKTTAASFGLQAGGQKFGYAMFFMTDGALEYLKNSKGWEVGVGPSVVVVDEGVARSLTTSTAKESIYVFFFGQKGLMAGLGIQGSKINQIHPK